VLTLRPGGVPWSRHRYALDQLLRLATFLALPALRVDAVARFLATFLALPALRVDAVARFLATFLRVGLNRFSIRLAVSELLIAAAASLRPSCTRFPAAAVAAPTVPTASPTISAA
jgi:hypothetical protein